jgi:hypothetical protein
MTPGRSATVPSRGDVIPLMKIGAIKAEQLRAVESRLRATLEL